MSALLKAGKRVLIPYSDARYDLVVEQDGEFIRIQCKAGRLAPNHRAIQFCTTSLNTVQGKHVKQNYRGQVEFFGVYCGEIDKVYLVPVEDVGTDNATLHLSKPRSRSTEDVRLAATYEFSPPNPKFELDPYQYPVYRDPATSYNLRIERSKWVLRWRVGAYGPEQVRKSLDVGLVSKYPTRQEILAAMGWEPSERLSAQIRPATRRKKLPISRTVKARKLKTPEAKSG